MVPTTLEPTRELLREVLIHGPIVRSELSGRLGLSMASIARLAKTLIDDGVLVEGALSADRQVGRPARPLDIRADRRQFVGIKLTGDEALGVATDLRASELSHAALPLDEKAPAHVVDVLVHLVDEVLDKADVPRGGLRAVGVSVGGKVGAGGVVVRAPFLNWRDVPLGALLTERLGLPVSIENDVTALTVAEQWFGAGRGVSDFAVLTVGAGVGYGLVIADRVRDVPDAGLGLGGHYPIDPGGPVCLDGHHGCSTAVLSIPGITGQLGAALGRTLDYAQALELAHRGDPAAVAVTQAAGRGLGRMIAAIANLAMVNRVVLSGEGVEIVDVAREAMLAALAADRDPDAEPVDVVVQPMGFGHWARGAAAVAIQAAVLGTESR